MGTNLRNLTLPSYVGKISYLVNSMLKKSNRLAKDKDIHRTIARGRAFFSPFFSIKFLAFPGPTRLTVVVSTKVFKKAVSRNRLKRIVREYLRKNLQALKSGNYLISAKPKAAKASEKDLLADFIQLAAKLKK